MSTKTIENNSLLCRLKIFFTVERLKNSLPYALIILQFFVMDWATRSVSTELSFYPLYHYIPNGLTFLYSLFFVGIVSIFKSTGKKIAYIILFVFWLTMMLTQVIYCISERVYFSFIQVTFAGEGSSYILDALFDTFSQKPYLIVVVLFLIVTFFVVLCTLPKSTKRKFKFFIISSLLLALCMGAITLHSVCNKNTNIRRSNEIGTKVYYVYPINIYLDFTDKNKSMLFAGLFQYTFKDVHVLLGNNNNIIISNEEEEFLQQQYQSKEKPTNKYTGIFKDKNVIFVQLESIDDTLINKEYMPTIYEMKNNCINFSQHYSMCVGGGSTIGSEFAVNNSLYTPITYGDTAYRLTQNSYPFSIPRMVKDAGYKCSVFHFNIGSFYNRLSIYNTWGYDKYYSLIDSGDYDSNPIVAQLDSELIKNPTFNKNLFNKDSRFIDYLITYSAHGSYNIENDRLHCMSESNNELVENCINKIEHLGDQYDEKQFLVAQTMATETDKMMKLLLDELKANDLFDNTIIVAYGDHYLYPIADCSAEKSRTGDNGKLINNTPFFIWSSDCEKTDIDIPNMQIDILPTVLNMIGIDYDPAQYVGEDVFSNEMPFVFFDDQSVFDGQFYLSGNSVKYVDTNTWNNEAAILDKSKNNFVTGSGKSISVSKVNQLKVASQNKIRKNDFTLKYNYLANKG